MTKSKKAPYTKAKQYYNWIIQKPLKLRLEPEQDGLMMVMMKKTFTQRQHAYGYTTEDVKMLVTQWLKKDMKPSVMGEIRHCSVITESRHISNYFKQHFAQVVIHQSDPFVNVW